MAVFFNDENKWRPRGKCKEEKKALHLWGARPVIFAAVVPSAALSGHLSSAGFSQSLKAPWAQHQWSTWQNAHNCVYLQGTTPEKAHRSRSRPRAKPAFISRLCSLIFSSTGCTQLLRIALICKISEVSSSNDLKGTRADSGTSLQLSGVGFLDLPCHSHHEPVVHANLSKTGSNRADVLLWKPGFEEFHCEACRDT